MARRDHKKPPLYRKVNTRARNVEHNFGGDFGNDRNSRAETANLQNEVTRGKMKGGVQRGLDYTPLFRFLVSKVGQPWSEVHSEAVARLDKQEPLYWLVSEDFETAEPIIRTGESTYFSGLFVDADGVLRKVDPSLSAMSMTPTCPCCTHTFNGDIFGIRKTHEDFRNERTDRGFD